MHIFFFSFSRFHSLCTPKRGVAVSSLGQLSLPNSNFKNWKIQPDGKSKWSQPRKSWQDVSCGQNLNTKDAVEGMDSFKNSDLQIARDTADGRWTWHMLTHLGTRLDSICTTCVGVQIQYFDTAVACHKLQLKAQLKVCRWQAVWAAAIKCRVQTPSLEQLDSYTPFVR